MGKNLLRIICAVLCITQLMGLPCAAAEAGKKSDELTTDANAATGTGSTETEASSEGDEINGTASANDGILNGFEFDQVSGDGFTVGIPTGSNWFNREYLNRDIGELFRDEYSSEDAAYIVEGRLYLMENLIEAGYAEDPEKVKEILLEVAKNHPMVLQDPAPMCHYNYSKDSSIYFFVRVWTKGSDYWTVNWDLNEQLTKTLMENGVQIPFPQVTVSYRKEAGK